MTDGAAVSQPEDTPLTQLRLATQIEDLTALLPRNVLPSADPKRIPHIEALDTYVQRQDKTLRVLRNADLNSEGPAVAAARRAKKRQGDQLASARHNVKKVCVQDDIHSPLPANGTSSDPTTPTDGTPSAQNTSHLATSNRDHAEDESRARIIERLRDIWSGDETCGVPNRWQVKAFDTKSANMYLNLCQSVKSRGMRLSCLWVESPQYIENECRAQGTFSTVALGNAIEMFERDGAQSLLQNVQRLKASSEVRQKQEHSALIPPKGFQRTGRVVTPRRVRCSSDQQQIFDSSGVEFPPLPGNDQRPGAMPQKVFEYLTAEADKPCEVTEPEGSSKKSPFLPTAEGDQEPTESLEADATQEVSASQWPASPDYAAGKIAETNARPPHESPSLSSVLSYISPIDDISTLRRHPRALQLPPDSSQIEPSVKSLQDFSANTSSKGPSSQAEDHNSPEPNATPTGPERESSRRAESPGNLRSAGSASSSELEFRPAHIKSAASLNQKPSQNSSEQTRQREGGPVQVAQTPFPGRLGHHLNVDDPNSTFVPSTFQEVVKHISTTDLPETSQPSNNMPKTTPSSNKLPVTAGSSSDRDEQHSVSKPQSQHAKQVPSKPSTEELSTTEYARKLQDARDWRRSVLKPISKGQVDQRRKPWTSSVLEERNGAPRAELSHRALTIGTSPKSARALATPAVAQSVHPQVNDTRTTTLQFPGTADSPAGLIGGLYGLFIDSYGDYHGTFKQFEVACRLVLKHSTTVRLHSFLLDDFVFHYAQSYAPYLGQCHQLGEDPSTYLDYFDSIEPTHFKKLITISDLRTSLKVQSSTSSEEAKAGQLSLPLEDDQQQSIVEKAAVSHKEHLRTSESSARNGISAPELHLEASQKSSVEEWLERTVIQRPPSPELGTQGLDRSLEPSPAREGQSRKAVSTKRSLDDRASSRDASIPSTKRKVAPTPACSAPQASLAKVTAAPRMSLPQGHSPSTQRSAKTPTLPPRSTAVRRSLPASFTTVEKSRNVASSAPIPASTGKGVTAFAKPAPIARPRPQSSAQPTTSIQLQWKAPTSSFTKPSSSARRSLSPGWWQDENTPFKRFAACWMKLPP